MHAVGMRATAGSPDARAVVPERPGQSLPNLLEGVWNSHTSACWRAEPPASLAAARCMRTGPRRMRARSSNVVRLHHASGDQREAAVDLCAGQGWLPTEDAVAEWQHPYRMASGGLARQAGGAGADSGLCAQGKLHPAAPRVGQIASRAGAPGRIAQVKPLACILRRTGQE